MSQENVNVVRGIYEAFGRGDIPAVLATLDPNIEWIAANNSPYADRSPYHGVNQVLEGVFMRIGADFDGFTIKVDELLEAGDKVVMLGSYGGAVKATGKPIDAQVAHVWTITDGKAIKWQQYTDTHHLAEAARQPANVAQSA
jgi:ketosteroid isomerase-like protein